jgi:hypothetical protein
MIPPLPLVARSRRFPMSKFKHVEQSILQETPERTAIASGQAFDLLRQVVPIKYGGVAFLQRQHLLLKP